MPAAPSPLDLVTIASPCTVPWDSMMGDGRKRFCGSCRLHVYDVSEMTRPEAEELLLRSEGRVCARLWHRSDGTLITKDCGPVRAAIERRLRWVRIAAASVLGALGFAGCHRPARSHVRTGAIPFPSVTQPAEAPPTPTMESPEDEDPPTPTKSRWPPRR